VDDPDEPTIVVPKPSAGQPDAPAEAEEPAAVEPEAPAEAEEPAAVQKPDPGPPIPVSTFSTEEALAFLATRTGLTDEAGEDQADVARVVRLCLEAVPSGAGHRVMELVSVLSGAGVPRDLLDSAAKAGILGGRLPSAEVDAALDQLVALSLLTFSPDGQTVTANSLVPRVVRAGLSATGLAEVCRDAASLLHAHAQAPAGSPDRLAVRDIAEQLTALAQVAGSASQTDQDLARMLLQLRFLALYHLIELGDSTAQAIAVGEPLTADLEQVLGPGHPDTLNARNSLATAYQAAERPAEAIPLFEQTLADRERVLGTDHPDTVTTRNYLALAGQDAVRAGED
jgi:Tetratricopeptide repeat